MSSEDADPNPALIIVEMSTARIGQLPTLARRQELATNCAKLAFSDFFHMVVDCRDIPGPALIPELRGIPNVHVLPKPNMASCFAGGSRLSQLLKTNGISHLCICGMDTDTSILKTVSDCTSLETYVIGDAVASSRGEAAHRQAIQNMSKQFGPDVVVQVEDLLGDDDEDEDEDDDYTEEIIETDEEDYTEIELEESLNEEDGGNEDDNISCDESMAPDVVPNTDDEEKAMELALARAALQFKQEEVARQMELTQKLEIASIGSGSVPPAAPVAAPAVAAPVAAFAPFQAPPAPTRAPAPIRAPIRAPAPVPAPAPVESAPAPAPATAAPAPSPAPIPAPASSPAPKAQAPLNFPSPSPAPSADSSVNSFTCASYDSEDPYAQVKAEAAKTKSRSFKPKIKKFRAPWAKRTTTPSYASVDENETVEPPKSPKKSPKTPKSAKSPTPSKTAKSPILSPFKAAKSPVKSPRPVPIPVNASTNKAPESATPANKSIASPTPVSETIKKFRVPARTSQPPWVTPTSKPSPAASEGYRSTGWQQNHVSNRVTGRINDLKAKGIRSVAAPQQRMKTPKIITDVREVWDKHDNLTRTTIKMITEIDGTKREERTVEKIPAGAPGNPIP